MPIRHVLLALVVVAIWGFNFVVIKLSVEAMPPLFAAALRFLAVAIPAVFFIKPPKAPAWLVIAYGLAFGFALYAFLNLSMAWGMPAGLSSLVLQVQAFFTMIIAFLILGERPNRFQIMGAGVAFFGIAVIATERLSGTELLPLSFTVLAALAWGVANVLTRMAGRVNPLSLTVWGSLAAPLPLLALSLLTEGGAAIATAISSFSLSDAGLIAFLAYPSSMLGGVIWAWLLMRHPASVVAPFTLLVPVTGLVSAYLVLGETITGVEILGAMFVIAGLAVTLAKRRPVA
ncbi:MULTISPECIES: EamA family transporter [unclassified Devosia]|uniref:EamA family transporter n=1 Tax=unclassified Devosia TaxID=196773 RepID=UPI00145D4DD1|nr:MULTISPECIES: EamA family transporter [unclassified Devosia]MBJ6988472.1 EamA family transporter [Devosia sp. MC521]QMW62516.1 EamA family transporter [Devosia sp. MC521]